MSIKGFNIGGQIQKYDYESLDNLPGEQGVSDDLKQALLQLAQKVAYVDDDGETYYQDLYDALYPPATLVSIDAVFTQGSTVIYDTASLDSLKSMLVVTATYDDSSTEVLQSTAYTLSGTLTPGTSTVTVTYNSLTTTFTVTVTAAPTLSSISAVYTQSGTVYPDTSLDSLKNDLVVTATYSDSSTATVAAADYTLSGTLTGGTSTITVSYGGKTTTVSVTVTRRQSYLYHFDDNVSSSGTADFGLSTPTPNYGTGKFGKAVYVGSGTVANVPRAINVASGNLPALDGDFTIALWAMTNDNAKSMSYFRNIVSQSTTEQITNSLTNDNVTMYNGFSKPTGDFGGTITRNYTGIGITQTGNGPYIFMYSSDRNYVAFFTVMQKLTINTWNHIAVCRKNGTVSIYLNGQRVVSFPFAYSLFVPNQLGFGCSFNTTPGSSEISVPSGAAPKIDEFYLLNGIALYDGDFTVPTEPYVAP